MVLYVDILGFIGSFLLAFMAIPQIYAIYKRKSADDIAYGMLVMLGFGYMLFLIYGILLPSTPIIASTSLSLFNLIVLICMKFTYTPKPEILPN
jgi:MtN3 and saliva related transmembrane protein